MRVYFAGNVAGSKATPPDPIDYDTGVRHRLLSYAFRDDWAKEAFAFWIANQPQDVTVMMDSGAFSVHHQGATIDLNQYCDYLWRHREALAAYVVLDVIGSAQKTADNLYEMRRRGLDPLPVYHSNLEPLSVWERILDENTGYVCLAGLATNRPEQAALRERLVACWRAVGRHWPVKVHGLGVTTQWVLEQFPFYSVDSASAIRSAGMGGVYRMRYGEQRALDWREDLRRFGDGTVADGVGRIAEAPGKSDSAHAGRRRRNIKTQLALERYVTDLWARRGISWNADGVYTGTAL